MSAVKMKFVVSENLTVEFDATDDKDAFRKLSQYCEVFAPKTCPECGGTNQRYDVRTPQGYEYFSIVCACGHEYKFGMRQEDGSLFPKGWFPPYSPDRQDDAPARSAPSAASQPVSEDEIPF